MSPSAVVCGEEQLGPRQTYAVGAPLTIVTTDGAEVWVRSANNLISSLIIAMVTTFYSTTGGLRNAPVLRSKAPLATVSDGAVEPCLNVSLPWSLFGWLITAVALSFGAPVWFDILGLAVNLRGDGSRKPQGARAADA